MNKLGLLESSFLSSNESEPSLNLVLIHDEEIAATEARRIVLRLLTGSFPNLDIHQDNWSFLELTHPQCRREAVELAANCDLLVLSTVKGEGLPPDIVVWLNEWLTTRTPKDTAIVCLVGSTDGRELDTPVHKYLLGKARIHNLGFFSSGFTTEQAENEVPASVETHARSEDGTKYLPRPDSWGINE